MEDIVHFLQEKLSQDFIYDHDVTIENLKVSYTVFILLH